MKLAIILLSIILLLSGCVEYPYTGKHVPIEGTETLAEKVKLAKSVLGALPPEQIRKQIQQRFPKLSRSDLKRIEFDYAEMDFHDSNGGAQRQEVHLTVTVYQNARLHPVADQIEEFVASLFQAELKRQRSAAPNQGAAANRRPAGQSDGSGNLSATLAADRAFPAAVAELGR
jgi:hypothetical protein